jgi:hypothetical protein
MDMAVAILVGRDGIEYWRWPEILNGNIFDNTQRDS